MKKTFIEVGSCDFNTLNNLADEGWRGFIIDPMEKYLNNIPRKEGVHYLPIGLDHVKGERMIHYASDSQVGWDRDWAGMSTFLSKDERDWGHNINDSSEDLLGCELLIKTDTFENIIEEYNIESIDFLKIDTEGYDFEIIKSFPWGNKQLKPSIIKCEIDKLSYLHKLEIKKYLEKRLYHVYLEEHDLYAIKLR
jgi:FkbM family methyltransferase|tara:strand:- start:3537 stop:4118 length:582 start_codon:yes stop_codon:yes gene_type:complete